MVSTYAPIVQGNNAYNFEDAVASEKVMLPLDADSVIVLAVVDNDAGRQRADDGCERRHSRVIDESAVDGKV